MKLNLTILLLTGCLNIYSQDYSLKKFIGDFYIYNGLQYQGRVVFGTDKGVVSIDKSFNVLMFDESIKGAIQIRDNQIKQGQEITYGNNYNYLLPKKYLLSNGFKFDDLLYIVSQGNLFVFQQNNYNFTPYKSVRSISENYVGTYGGVLYNNDTLAFPSFTDSYIREFPEATFICWNGLTMITNKGVKSWNIEEKSGFEFGGVYIGYAIDIIVVNHPTYIINTSKGLYKINVETEEILALKKNTMQPYNICYSEYSENELKLLYYNDDKTLFEYNVKTNTENILYRDVNIIDVFGVASTVFYILTKKSLVKYNFDTNKNIIINKGLNEGHQIGVFYNYLYILSNFGLSLYNLHDQILLKNVIADEFNKKAHYIKKNSIFLGSVNGLYEFSTENFDDIYFSKLNTLSKKIESQNNLSVDLLFIVLLSISVLLLTIFGIKILKRLKPVRNEIDFNEKIKEYINHNIKTVSVQSICDEFNLSSYGLYEIMKEPKAGKYIQKQRLKLVKQLKLKKISDEEISEKTGFSVSYIRQLK